MISILEALIDVCCSRQSAMSGLMNIAKFKPKDRYVGYLPLAHVLELLAETSLLFIGSKIGYR
jgi:long-subunit acyl-CoA synthetase (AMP-forming)